MKTLEYVKEHIDEIEQDKFLDTRFTKRFIDFLLKMRNTFHISIIKKLVTEKKNMGNYWCRDLVLNLL